MPIEIIVPRLGWSMEEGAFVAWLKQEGEWVRAGEQLLSIEGDKAVQEIESIDSGILRIAAPGPKPGDTIRVGQVLGHLVSADESAPAPVQARSKEPGTPVRSVEILPDREPGPIPAPVPISPVRSSGNVPTISPRALRVAAELGVDWTTVAGTGRTGRIRERDIRGASGG